MERQDILLKHLLTLIHEEAQRAYWSDRNDCGGEMTLECENCNHQSQCLSEKEIDKAFEALFEGR